MRRDASRGVTPKTGSEYTSYRERFGAAFGYAEVILEWTVENWDPDDRARFFDDGGAGNILR